MTLSEAKNNKADLTGEREAYARDEEAIKAQKAHEAFLRENPEVGELNRDGVKILYRFENGVYAEFTLNN